MQLNDGARGDVEANHLLDSLPCQRQVLTFETSRLIFDHPLDVELGTFSGIMFARAHVAKSVGRAPAT